jgi:2'-5' RNA ligase
MTDMADRSGLRLFIAICLPSNIVSVLAGYQRQLSKAGVHARWVKPESTHLTLTFIGRAPLEHLPSIKTAMACATMQTPPFMLELQGAGAFPNLRRARVIWAGIRGQVDILKSLQAHLDTRLLEAGVISPTKPFHPHLTLGRFKKPPAVSALATAMRHAVSTPSSTAFAVDAIWLIQSELYRHGAVYTKLFSSPLGAGIRHLKDKHCLHKQSCKNQDRNGYGRV